MDHDEVVRNAEKHGSGDSGLFSTAMSFLSDNKVGVGLIFESIALNAD